MEKVDHPAHYGGDTTYETIKVIEAWELNFNLGNVVKYISRAGKKDNTKTKEDLEKARWYLQRELGKYSNEIQPEKSLSQLKEEHFDNVANNALGSTDRGENRLHGGVGM